jgi:hypothetical protein
MLASGTTNQSVRRCPPLTRCCRSRASGIGQPDQLGRLLLAGVSLLSFGVIWPA